MKIIFFTFLTSITISLVHSQTLEWARNLGGNSSTFGSSITSDDDGNVYTIGSFYGVADFNPGSDDYNLSSAGDSDIFISKLDADGNFVWAKRLGGIYSDFASTISIDDNGNIYAGGSFSNTVDFDPGTSVFNLTSVGDYDSFILKLNNNGDFEWAKKIGNTGFEKIERIKTDTFGNVYSAGWYNSETVDFNPGTGVCNLISNGKFDFFILKLDVNGNFIWAKSIGGTESDKSYDLTIDTSNNLIITGYYRSIIDFDPGAGVYYLETSLAPDVFILKLDSDGEFIWAKSVGGGGNDKGFSVATDTNNNVYISGLYYCAGDFDPGPNSFILSGSNGSFVLKLDVNGDFIWAKGIWGDSITNAMSISIDNSGNAFITGYFHGETDFDPSSEVYNLSASDGAADIFILRLNSNGSFIWAINLGSDTNDIGESIHINNSTIYTTGSFAGLADFDPGPDFEYLNSNGYSDAYILKISDEMLNTVNSNIPKLTIFPNPSKSLVSIDCQERIKVIVYNALGEKIIETTNEVISLNKETSGIYYFFVYNEENVLIGKRKIIKI